MCCVRAWFWYTIYFSLICQGFYIHKKIRCVSFPNLIMLRCLSFAYITLVKYVFLIYLLGLSSCSTEYSQFKQTRFMYWKLLVSTSISNLHFRDRKRKFYFSRAWNLQFCQSWEFSVHFLLQFLSPICHEKNNNCRERHDIVCCILYIYHDYIILFSHPCLNMQYPILSHLYGLADDEKLRRNKMKLWEDEIIWPRCINIKGTFLKSIKFWVINIVVVLIICTKYYNISQTFSLKYSDVGMQLYLFVLLYYYQYSTIHILYGWNSRKNNKHK